MGIYLNGRSAYGLFQEDKDRFTKFLSNLLKDNAYVKLAYMTGILPIAKYSSGSELNMFFEYSMASRVKYSEYFGFTDEEVDWLFEKYLEVTESPRVTREELRLWYDGYQTAGDTKTMEELMEYAHNPYGG